MCRNNYLKYLKSGDLVTYKKYLYAYRGLVNAKWVAHKRSIPPINFVDALKEMKGILPESIMIERDMLLINIYIEYIIIYVNTCIYTHHYYVLNEIIYYKRTFNSNIFIKISVISFFKRRTYFFIVP